MEASPTSSVGGESPRRQISYDGGPEDFLALALLKVELVKSGWSWIQANRFVEDLAKLPVE